jgi:hypothetical protein
MFDLIVEFILNYLKGLMIESFENGQFSLKILQMIVYLYFTFNKIILGAGNAGLELIHLEEEEEGYCHHHEPVTSELY